jgi:Spy/CpxP family protein refolding chaperone
MNNRLAAIAFAFSMVAGPSAWAQGNTSDATDLQALRAAAKADRKGLVASQLQLTEAEAKKFWPLYDTYQRTVDLANRERSLALEDLIAPTKPISDLYAKNLAKELVAADETEVRARRKLYSGLMRALPAKKAARYLQLEAKIRTVQAYDIAAAIPLIK